MKASPRIEQLKDNESNQTYGMSFFPIFSLPTWARVFLLEKNYINQRIIFHVIDSYFFQFKAYA